MTAQNRRKIHGFPDQDLEYKPDRCQPIQNICIVNEILAKLFEMQLTSSSNSVVFAFNTEAEL